MTTDNDPIVAFFDWLFELFGLSSPASSPEPGISAAGAPERSATITPSRSATVTPSRTATETFSRLSPINLTLPTVHSKAVTLRKNVLNPVAGITRAG